jgi:hypothetical protein
MSKQLLSEWPITIAVINLHVGEQLLDLDDYLLLKHELDIYLFYLLL